jgi:hypothetical protein
MITVLQEKHRFLTGQTNIRNTKKFRNKSHQNIGFLELEQKTGQKGHLF